MRIAATIIALSITQILLAQQQNRNEDIFFKKYLVRSLDFREQTNEQLFGADKYMLQILLNAYCEGTIKGYKNNGLKEVLTCEEYETRLKLIENENLAAFPWKAVNTMEIGENLIFNKHTSDYYFSMESITLYIPAEISYRGLQEPLVSFSYAECSKLFKGNPEAVSVNPLKNGRDINYADMFLLRCFNSCIVKIGNSRDLYFDQAHVDQLSAFMAAKDGENKLTEYIYKLYHPE